MSSPSPELLRPNEHVLSTLEGDGSRRWLRPRLARGRLWRWRRVVAYGLLVLYSGLPWLRVDGEPAVLIDIPGRQLTLFGGTFLATDTALLALALLLIFLGVFFLTALFGRVWCGWACPQTVYLEFVYRPIERLFTGRSGKGGAPRKHLPAWRKIGMYATFLLISAHLAQTFVAYFVGAHELREWIWGSPFEHPTPFVVVLLVTAAMMVDFCYWREQLCIIGCPYGRLQSVLLDRDSLIVAYDEDRGEPRAPLRKSQNKDRASDGALRGRGSCVDCSMCVQVCPTGIDIREGLQMECIHCTQCVDACDEIMERTNQPKGLIRYSSQAALEGEGKRFLRPRVLAYGGLIIGLGALLLTMVATKPAADVTVLRGLGRPFVALASGEVENTMRIKVTNRTDSRRRYSFEVSSPSEARFAGKGARELVLETGESATEPLHVLVPGSLFTRGTKVPAELRVSDDQGWVTTEAFHLLGAPARPGSETDR